VIDGLTTFEKSPQPLLKRGGKVEPINALWLLNPRHQLLPSPASGKRLGEGDRNDRIHFLTGQTLV